MNESLKTKIEKLLRLGESPNANESAEAIAKAQRLMSKHGIEEAMLSLNGDTLPSDVVDAPNDPLFDKVVVPAWVSMLANEISTTNGCKAYFESRIGVKIVGRPDDISNVRYLFAFCLSEVAALGKSNAMGRGLAYANSYRIGCVAAICDAIEMEREALREKLYREALESQKRNAVENLSLAIITVDNRVSLATAHIENNLEMRLGKKRPRVFQGDDHHEAMRAGMRDGAEIWDGTKGNRRIK